MSYTTIDAVKELLRASTGKIKVATEEIQAGQDYDITENEIQNQIDQIEARMNLKLDAFSLIKTNTNALKYIATRLVAYEIYRMLYPTTSVNEIPSAVNGWKKDADEAFADLEKLNSSIPGALGTPDWQDQT